MSHGNIPPVLDYRGRPCLETSSAQRAGCGAVCLSAFLGGVGLAIGSGVLFGTLFMAISDDLSAVIAAMVGAVSGLVVGMIVGAVVAMIGPTWPRGGRMRGCYRVGVISFSIMFAWLLAADTLVCLPGYIPVYRLSERPLIGWLATTPIKLSSTSYSYSMLYLTVTVNSAIWAAAGSVVLAAITAAILRIARGSESGIKRATPIYEDALGAETRDFTSRLGRNPKGP